MPLTNAPQNVETRIQRTFRDLSQEEVSDFERALFLTKMGWSGAFGWEKLLESQRVLIISEAGAGKTYECRAQQEALWGQGEPAFYLDLAELATNNLRDLLSENEEARLDAWLAAQSDIATFFLDSIDELKLTLGSFETALKRLSKIIASQLSRVRIVITTRPIAVDRLLIRKHLPVPDPVELVASGDAFADIAMGRQQQVSSQKEDGAPPIWRNIALMPLSGAQIREMAAIEGIEDPDALVADIRARNAEDFARRPQDLIEICADWRDNGRIRTHREQVAHNIRVKLKPSTDRREPAQLSPDRALEGASRLALAALLTRKLTIRLSVEADRGGVPGTALDPASVLYDWTPEERETLLERALFGFASYGRVKFHHRSVVEFLAAQHLHNRLGQGMPVKAVKRLLFAETPQGVKVVRPTMRPVAAWLAAWQSSIFYEIREREPEVLFDHADPESLPLSERASALRSYVRRYGEGGWRGLQIPQVQVHRFASPDLAEHILELWQAGIENHEVRELLLELVAEGPIPACADIAHSVTIDGAATYAERLYAIDALVRLDDPRIEAITKSMVGTQEVWPDALLRGAIVRIFPQHIAPDQLCKILQHVLESSKMMDEIGWVLPRKIAKLELAQGYLAALREGFTDLVTEGLVWDKECCEFVTKRPHLLSALAVVCLMLIRAGEQGEAVLHSSVIVIRLHNDDGAPNEFVQDLRNALAELTAPLREEVFWIDDAFNESLHPQDDPWKRFFNAEYYGPLNLNDAQDGSWVRRSLTDPSRPLLQRTMMLHAALQGVWYGDGSALDHAEGLKQHVADVPELIALIDRHLTPREIDPERAEREARMELRRKASQRLEAENHAAWVAFWREVAEHPETAFSPDRKGDTARSLWQAMQRSGNESRASGWNRRFIERHFGKEVADRLRSTMLSIWRKDRPTLRCERPADERSTILIRWRLGLAAITAEAEDPGWVRKLPVDEVELAARYALIESNGFPTWLEALAREYPAAVERTLGPDLTSELEEIAAPNSFDILLQNVSHSPAVVSELFLPRLRTWLDDHSCNLQEGEDVTVATRRLHRVLKILLDSGDDAIRGHIRTMAKDHLEVANAGPFTQVWLTTLMRIDPAAGTEALERLLMPVEPAATGYAVNIFGVMFGDRFENLRVDLGSDDFTSAVLLRLARLAYTHVRRSDDITHEGTDTPGPRDEAQSGRYALLSAILDGKGTDAWAVKLQMVEDPLFAHFRDRLALLAREKAAEEADGTVLTEAEVATFERYGEAPPTTRDEMFAVLADRLDDLDDLLLQDVSPRDAWALIKDEKVMRREIARELRSASNQLYTVDQEAVTADEKETDIRLRALSGQQATIELKLGKNWSGRVLRDTIQKQLVTKYMAAESCRSGCLLVTVSSNQNWIHPDTGVKVDINGLRAMLVAEADRIVDKLGSSLRLVVKVLDLRPRLAVEPN